MQNFSKYNNEIHIKLTEFDINPNVNAIFHMMDCYPDNSVYGMVEEEYNKIINEVYSLIVPVSLIHFADMDCRLNFISSDLDTLNSCTGSRQDCKAPACYVFMTIGDQVEKLSTKYFHKGNYLAGLLVNAIADDYLMQLDDEVCNRIDKICQHKMVGVISRLEIPRDIPMDAQKIVLEITGADRELDIGLTEGFMFTTLKSNCFILRLSRDEGNRNIKHECSNCKQENCKMRSCY